MEVKDLIIHYFSGTGNALKAAEWLKEFAVQKGISAMLISIDRFKEIPRPPDNKQSLITFCYPTHGFNAAPLFLKYIFRFPRGKNKVLLINTRGGTKLGKLYFPGLSGAAMFLPMLMLIFKGYKICGSLPFDMPSNWVSVHPGFTDKAKNEIADRRKKELFKFAERLFIKGRAFSYKIFVYLPLDLAVLPIVPGYYFCGRYIIAKSFYTSSECNDCHICEANCPTNSIKIIYNRPFWSYTCESCMRCISICPKKSIQTGHLFVIGFMYLLSVFPVVAAAANFFNIDTKDNWLIGLGAMFVNWFVTVLLIVIAYRIYSLLLKIKFINKIFEYTSLTRFWRRYLAPGTTIKNFR